MNDATSQPAPGSFRPITWRFAKVVLLLATAAFVALYLVELVEILSPANGFLARVSLVGATLITLAIWFVRSGPAARVTRRRVGWTALAAVAVLVSVLRIEGVSGDIIPQLKFRWSPHADEMLPRAADHKPAELVVDLTPSTANDYPQFLGANRLATLTGVELARDWKAKPPRLVWKQPIGAGWSAFAVVGDFAVTQEQRGEDELITCYHVPTGKLVWSQAEPVRFEATLAGTGPRATPTLDGGRVYAMGATGIVNCLDGATGEVLWKHDIVKETGAVVPAWGKSCSPLVYKDLVIVSAGGPRGKSLLAFDKLSGKLVWSRGDAPSSYASAMITTLGGVEQLLMINVNDLTAHDPTDGRILWTYPWTGEDPGNPSCSQPIAVGDERILLSKGYGNGSALVQVALEGDHWTAKPIWKSRNMKTKFTNVVIRDGFAYGLDEGILQCIEIATGNKQWKQGKFNHGQLMLVDDLLLVQSEAGDLALVEANPQGFRELSRIPAITGTCWNTPTLSGKRLLVRSNEEAACFELP